MTHHGQNSRKSLGNLVECYQKGLAFLLNIESKCRDADDVAFIEKNLATIRSNNKMVNLYGSILEESVVITTMSSINSNEDRASSERDSTRFLNASSIECDMLAIEDGEVSAVEEKYNVNNRKEHGYFTEEFIDLANQHVSFKENVTVVNFTTSTKEQAAATMPVEKRTKRLKKPASAKKIDNLPAKYIQQIRDGNIEFQRKSKRTIGLCFFCDEMKSFTKLQWQMHLLTHTKENYYFCGDCRMTFSKRISHTSSSCSPDSITNIYEGYNCTEEDGLAAFMCNICNYVRVSELKLVNHLRKEHNCKMNVEQSYQKCNFVKNLC